MPKRSRFSPQHEPEVIAAREHAKRNVGEIPLLYLKEIIIEGTRIMSRHDDARVTERTAASFRRLPVRLRRAVHAMCYDPEASICIVGLHEGNRSKAESLATHLIESLRDEFGNFHTVYVADIEGEVGIMEQKPT